MCKLNKNFNKYSVEICLDNIVKIIKFYNEENIIPTYNNFTINIERFMVNEYRRESEIRINLCNYEVDGLNLYLYSEFIKVKNSEEIDEYNLLAYVTKYLNECGEDLSLNFTVNHREH